MTPIRKLSALVLSASLMATLAPVSAAPAQTALEQARSSMTGPRSCAILVYLHNDRGMVMPRTGGALSGSYRFHMYQVNRSNGLDMRLSGRVAPTRSDYNVLARGQFELGGYNRTASRNEFRRNGPEPLRADPELEASLEVYDEAGRVTCRTERMLILPLDVRFGGGASERVGVSPRRRF